MINFFFQLRRDGTVVGVKFVPFAAFIHERDLTRLDDIWDKSVTDLKEIFKLIYSESGPEYEKQSLAKTAFQVSKQKSVIVLGSYHKPDIGELEGVRDYLKKDYDAKLLKDLPDIPFMSNNQKVGLCCDAARFSVMVDRMPAGHLAEYEILRTRGDTLAILCPEGAPSSSMIGEDHNYPYIRVFSFKETPFEVLEKAVSWAEEWIRQRGNYFKHE